eukprot:Sspe_Gene.52306::Locus_28989_Transcript_1_3_Confidence_0.600_Length_1801::g.52306::m.52306
MGRGQHPRRSPQGAVPTPSEGTVLYLICTRGFCEHHLTQIRSEAIASIPTAPPTRTAFRVVDMWRRGAARLVRWASSTPTVQERTLPDGSVLKGTFSTRNTLATGSKYHKDGRVAKGQFNERGELSVGELRLPDGRVFTGKFKDGVIEHGTLQEDNATYEGGFKGWRRSGQGREVMEDGTVYEGEFEDDQLVRGTAQGKDLRFEGELRDGEFRKGRLEYRGMVYEGELTKNNPHGKGRLTLPDGTVQSGEFRNGVLHGAGRIILKNGAVYEGEFTEGVLPSGTARYPNGDEYDGDFDNFLPHGTGTMRKAEHVWAGEWLRGTFSGGSVTDLEGTPVDYRTTAPRDGPLIPPNAA